jgi:DMSO/TMAO reductase YedYZ molybdopterin-dependent catalytic subunit
MTELEPHDVPDDVYPDSWRLLVTGCVEREVAFDDADLRALATASYTSDVSCVEGWTAEGLSWRGVRVGALMSRAGLGPESSHVLVRAMDGEYACSLPVARLDDALLAVELDGDRLPVEHGGPARLVPTDEGDCWEHVKWVEELEVRESPPADDDTAERIALSRIP